MDYNELKWTSHDLIHDQITDWITDWIMNQITDLDLDKLKLQKFCLGSERYISFHQSVKNNVTHSCFLRSLNFFHCWRVRHIGSYNSQTDQPKCSTLQGQSLRHYLRCPTSYRSLQYLTNKKLFSIKHLL